MEAKAGAARLRQKGQVGAGRLQQGGGSHDVGAQEGQSAAGGGVDAGLGGQVQHCVGLVAGEDRGHGLAVADVGVFEGVAGAGLNLPDAVRVAGLGDGVDVDDGEALAEGAADHRGADESAAAGDEDLHAHAPATALGDSRISKITCLIKLLDELTQFVLLPLRVKVARAAGRMRG